MADRLIIHTDSISKSDVNTFQAAAARLQLDYRKYYPADNIKVVFVKSGKEIAAVINGFGNGKIISLDIVSHGNQGGIHIARRLAKPVNSGLIQRRAHVNIRSGSNSPQDESQAEFIEESMHGLYTDWAAKKGVSYYYNQRYEDSTDTAYIADIVFSRFTTDAFVEFHGCRTAEIVPGLNTYFKDNFAKQFSEQLPRGAIVVGHIQNSNPNKNPNGKSSDYRHGRIRAYRNGESIYDAVERRGVTFPNSSTPRKG